MPATPEQLLEASKIGRLSPDTGKRGKSKSTLIKERLRERFMERMESRFDKMLDKLEEVGHEKGNPHLLKDLLEQTIGKHKEEVEVSGELEFNINIGEDNADDNTLETPQESIKDSPEQSAV